MVFLKKLHNWMDNSNLNEFEKDLFIGYSIRAAFERKTLEDVADERVMSLFQRIREMDSYKELEKIIEESFDVNKDPVIDDECLIS